MKTHVEFRSSAFPAYDGEDAAINPGRWGKRLAEFLQRRFEEEKIPTEKIYFEDWGVAVPIKNEGFAIWIGCGNYEEYKDGFLCFIEPSKPTIRRWLRKIDTVPAVSKIADSLDRILRRNPEIHDIRWWTDNEKFG
jgi:hypothetical protein